MSLFFGCDNSQHQATIDDHNDTTPRYWRHSQTPATYLEDHVGAVGHRLEPLRKTWPWIDRNSVFPAQASDLPCHTVIKHPADPSPISIVTSSEYTTLSPPNPPAWGVGGAAAITPTENVASFTPKVGSTTEPDHAVLESEGSAHPSLTGSTMTDKSTMTLVSSTVAEFHPHHPYHPYHPYHSYQRASKDTQNSSPASSSSTPCGDNVSCNKGKGVDRMEENNSGVKNDYKPVQAASSDDSGQSKVLKTPKHSKPVVPRIVIPDGTSINLSTPPTTPPTTPRKELGTLNASKTLLWPHSLTQIIGRLQSRGRHTFVRRRTLEQQITSNESTLRQQRTGQAARQNAEGFGKDNIEMLENGSVEGRTGPRQQRETVDITEDPSLEENRRAAFGPGHGAMGLSASGYRPESIMSSEKDAWWEDEGIPRGSFSCSRWKYLLCTRPGLVTMFKHTATTLLGILIIIALGLTASGRIKDYEQVSDILPNSLAGSIMEAQIVVVKDFDLLAPPALGHRQLDTDYIPGADLHLHMARLETASKIPIWTGPIRPDCFDKKCDFGHFGNEYFAFMHPESFGIALRRNWPSLCNSCIEISTNDFVYKTRARILGDLLSCSPNFPMPSTTGAALPATYTISMNTQTASLQSSTTTTSTQKMVPTRVVHSHTSPMRPQSTDPYPMPSTQTRPIVRRPSTTTANKMEPNSGGGESSLPRLSYGERHQGQHSQSITHADNTAHQRHKAYKSPPARRVEKRQDPDVASLPYLIVDPATFSNLTAYETHQDLQGLDHLRVHFRFVLCDS